MTGNWEGLLEIFDAAITSNITVQIFPMLGRGYFMY